MTNNKKVCKKCNIEKNLSDFYFRKDNNKHRTECKICWNKIIKKKRKENPEYNKNYCKKWRKENPEYNKNYCKKWRKENPNSFSLYYNNRMKIDELFNMKESIRKSILTSFRRNKFSKESKTTDILGISFEDFKLYIESKFENWMTWKNKGLYNGNFNYGWDIDHIIPISLAKTKEDIIKLNNYTNLQPLCSKINRDIKKNKKVYKI